MWASDKEIVFANYKRDFRLIGPETYGEIQENISAFQMPA